MGKRGFLLRFQQRDGKGLRDRISAHNQGSEHIQDKVDHSPRWTEVSLDHLLGYNAKRRICR